MAYRRSEKADEDIITIYVDGVRDFGVTQAEKYHAELEQLFELIADTPKLARERHELKPPVRIHPYKSHIIIYIIDDRNDVLILRVRHGHEDWEFDPVG
ncbi:MAG: type II toxin-antitoxin system RelE/ParE family toxin [Devosiaceae bacterium]|nr:type II toxin-antitoxin system RelE/ParE family toxin [Devosiaceae bacterium]